MKGNTYIDEFLGIVGFLSHSQKVPIDKGYILVSRNCLLYTSDAADEL